MFGFKTVSAVVIGAAVVFSPRLCAADGPSGAGAPDLTMKIGQAWMEAGDEFTLPPSGAGPITNDPRYPYVDNGRARRTNGQPTYRVADLSNPILQPGAREQMRKANEDVIAGHVPFRPRERCYPAGVPGFVVYTLVMPFYFLQTPREVTIVNEGGPEIRHVFMNVPHSKNAIPSWYGESVGHYENGDTLVVDTIGITTKSFVDNYRTPHTEKLHVVERFRKIDGGKGLEDLITVDDPGAFTMPWSAVQRFRIADRTLVENICAENNYAFFDYGVAPLPQAARSEF